MSFYNKISAVLALLFFVGCQEVPDFYGDRALAKVDDKELTLREVDQVIPDGISGQDSVAFVDMYVDKWVKKQLKLREAEVMFSSAADDIKAMVEEYRQSLLIRKLDQYYVDRNVDTTFTDADVKKYYDDHIADFKLDRPLVRGRIVRFNEGYRQASKLMSLMGAASPTAQKNFSDLCIKNNFTLVDFSGGWVDFSEFLSHMPTLRSQNYDSVLTTAGVQQMRDNDSHYYYQITDVRRVGDAAPLHNVAETIRRILFNQRQSELIKSYEDDIYKKAVDGGQIKIYEND